MFDGAMVVPDCKYFSSTISKFGTGREGSEYCNENVAILAWKLIHMRQQNNEIDGMREYYEHSFLLSWNVLTHLQRQKERIENHLILFLLKPEMPMRNYFVADPFFGNFGFLHDSVFLRKFGYFLRFFPVICRTGQMRWIGKNILSNKICRKTMIHQSFFSHR